MGLRRHLVAFVVLIGALLLAPPAGAQPEPDTESETVTVAIHPLEPFVMNTTTGSLTGFSIDLWNEIANRLD